MKNWLTCCFSASGSENKTEESVFGPDDPPPPRTHVTGIAYITSSHFAKSFIKASFTGGDRLVQVELNQSLRDHSYQPFIRFQVVFDELKASRPELDTIGLGREVQVPELKFLWHGTRQENVASIMQHGFLPGKVNAYGSRIVFWFTPDISFARMYSSQSTSDYTVVLCAVLHAEAVDVNRFVVHYDKPENILPLAALKLLR